MRLVYYASLALIALPTSAEFRGAAGERAYIGETFLPNR